MKPVTIHPEGWAPALGYANGMLMPDGTLHIGGQIGWNADKIFEARDFIGQMEQDYHMDAVLRVKNCLYAHYTGPMPESQLASYKLQVHAFENEQKLTGTSYTIYVNQDEDDAVVDVFMETK